MAGSWELKKQRSILCGILHVDTTTVAWAFGLRNIIMPGAFLPVTGMPFDMGRNTVCKAALDNGFQWCAFLDSDVIPPPDAFVRLMSRGHKLISGVYFRRSPPEGVPVMIRNGTWVTNYPENALIDVDVVGAGCLLVHRSVLEQMKPQRPGHHWFDWRVNYQNTGLCPPGDCMSEDFTFCQSVKRQLGIPTIVDTSVVCKHIGFGEATKNQFKPSSVVA